MTHTPAPTDPAVVPPLNPVKITLTVVASAVGMLCIFLVLAVAMRTLRPRPDVSAYEQGVEKLSALVAGQQKELATFGWTDKAAGVVRVPLEQAQEALVRDGIGPASRPSAN